MATAALLGKSLAPRIARMHEQESGYTVRAVKR